MNIKAMLALLNPFKLIKKWLKSDKPMPDEIKIVFRTLYELTNKSMLAYATEAVQYKQNAENAKTKHKADLYMRKFKKTRKKFQDELHRLNQTISIMKDNGIDIPKPETGEKS